MQMLSEKDLAAAWHLVRQLLHPKQGRRWTVQQALEAEFLQL